MSEWQKTTWREFLRSRAGMILIAFLAVAGFLLVYEHRAHIFNGNGVLIALLAVCIGMHLFMHHGHGDHGGKDADHRHDEDDEGGSAR